MLISATRIPEGIKPDDVPAFAEEDTAARRVSLSHPLGTNHRNLLAAVERYRRRGFTVRIVHTQAAA